MSTRTLKKRTRKLRREPIPRPGIEGGKRDLNRKQRVDSLLAAALPLFLERGIEGVTIDDIVGAAGTAKGSYYRYFDDKAALVRALFETAEESVRAAFAKCEATLAAAKKTEELAPAYFVLAMELAAVVTEGPEIVRLYLQEARGPAVAARAPVVLLAKLIFDASVRLTQVAHARGLLRPMDPRVSAAAVVGAAERLLFGALSGEPLGEPEAVIQSLVTLVLEGLRAQR